MSTTTNASTVAGTGSSQVLSQRLSSFVQAHRQALTIAAVATTTAAVVGAGYYYYATHAPGGPGNADAGDGAERKKKKKVKGKGGKKSSAGSPRTADVTDKTPAPQPVMDAEDPRRLTPAEIELMSTGDRAALATTLKGKGNKAYSAKRYAEAIEFYSKAIECHEEAVFYSNRAACYTNLELPAKVIEDCTAALRLDPNYIKALNRRATAREQMGGLSELYLALCDFTAAAIIDEFKTDSTQVSVERVMKRLAQEQATQMLKDREPRLPSPTFIKAYLEAFRPHPAPVLPANPSQGDSTLILAFDALAARNFTHAFSLFNEAIIQKLSTPALEAEALNMRATFSFIMGEAKSALVDLDRATEICPTDVQSHVKKASVHMELGMPTEAFNDFEQALKIDPQNADVFYHRGQVYFITGDFPLAIAEYRRSSVLDPSFIFSHIQLAVAEYKQGEIVQALNHFEGLLKEHPTSGEVANYYGELLLDQGKFERAVEMFERSLALSKDSIPRNVLPMINHALALFQWKNDFSGAEVLCREAIAVDPQCDVGIATLAQLLLQQNKVEAAMGMFHRSAEMARTEVELVNSLTYENASRAQLAFIKNWPERAQLLGLVASNAV